MLYRALLPALASRDGGMAGIAGRCRNLNYCIFLSGGATSLGLCLNTSPTVSVAFSFYGMGVGSE